MLREAIDAINFLEADPVSTDDFVMYIKFLDKVHTKIDSMETRLEYAKEIYDIMDEYHIPVPAEDMANYLVRLKLPHRELQSMLIHEHRAAVNTNSVRLPTE